MCSGAVTHQWWFLKDWRGQEVPGWQPAHSFSEWASTGHCWTPALGLWVKGGLHPGPCLGCVRAERPLGGVLPGWCMNEALEALERKVQNPTEPGGCVAGGEQTPVPQMHRGRTSDPYSLLSLCPLPSAVRHHHDGLSPMPPLLYEGATATERLMGGPTDRRWPSPGR